MPRLAVAPPRPTRAVELPDDEDPTPVDDTGRLRGAGVSRRVAVAGFGEPAEIRFYSKATNPTYRPLSNFEEAPFELDGYVWPTVEHYFQAQKFVSSPAYQKIIREAESPASAKKLGQSRAYPIRPDWEDVKEDLMKRALLAKFACNPELMSLLLSTGASRLVEASPRDRYWGIGAAGDGRNRLGELLMQVRTQLRERDARSG